MRRVEFDQIDFYQNETRLFGADSVKLDVPEASPLLGAVGRSRERALGAAGDRAIVPLDRRDDRIRNGASAADADALCCTCESGRAPEWATRRATRRPFSSRRGRTVGTGTPLELNRRVAHSKTPALESNLIATAAQLRTIQVRFIDVSFVAAVAFGSWDGA